MKVSQLKQMLSEMNDDDDIFVLLYDKGRFDYDADDEMWLPPEKWAMIVAEYEAMPFASLWEDIHDAVVEYSEINPNWNEDETETTTA